MVYGYGHGSSEVRKVSVHGKKRNCNNSEKSTDIKAVHILPENGKYSEGPAGTFFPVNDFSRA